MKFDEHQNKISLTKSELSYRLNATVCGWNYFDYPIVIGNMVQQTLEVEILKKEECKKNNNGLSCAVYRQKINGCIEVIVETILSYFICVKKKKYKFYEKKNYILSTNNT